MATYAIVQILVGLAVLGAVVLPRLVSDKPLSFPILYVIAGMVLFALPIGVPAPDPVANPAVTERLTELVVIVALMGAGLKLDRPFSFRSWGLTWRLLLIVMPLTIFVTAALGLWVVGTLPATAVLLGAIVAPTDPVLASDVGATEPTEETDDEIDPGNQEDEVRFALSSEAGLNDGLAFPFTYLAIAMAGASGTASLGWLVDWAVLAVAYEILVGVVMGYVLGQLLARVVFGTQTDLELTTTTDLADVMAGAEALTATLVTYGVTEILGGYGFIAVFVAALELRHYEWEHDYYVDLHDFGVMIERLLMAVVLVLFGGAIVGGLLDPLTLTDAGVGLAILFVVRPLAGLVGLLGASVPWSERLVISSFGIRGIGSFYYLAYALNEASFGEIQLLIAQEKLWAILGFVVLTSVFVHGIAAYPVMEFLDRRQSEPASEEPAEPATD
ncbi:cation:proton antiporter [Halorussus marinus]|uniref:cation:proton antiporter n=1 Tax=Halorussus marinus TaxID=2505976 RepID=UPI001092A85A|nr:cation:proton antiporter [Halorussus marinus]